MSAAPLASVVEVDIEASKDVDKELLTRGNIDILQTANSHLFRGLL